MKILTKKTKIAIWIIVLILAIFLLNIFQKEVKEFFYYISAPIQKILLKVGKKEINSNELNELKLKNQELLVQIIHLQNVEKENESLREFLGLEPQKDFKISLAQLISKDVSQDSILINKGQKDGVAKNMPVITQQKVLAGRISEVYNNFSKVMLISNQKSFFDGEIQKEKDVISGMVKGQGNSGVLFDLVPREKELSEKDIVQTSALGGIFPAGLLVGEIKEIKKSDVEPFQQAEIEPAFSIKNINFLFVILDF